MSEIEGEAAPVRRPWTEATGLPFLVFVLGVMTGFPIAIFGFDFLVAHAAIAFAVLFGLLFVLTIVAVVVISLRQRIWQRLFQQGDIELHRLADPLSEVVRLSSERRVAEATIAASDLARVVMARYAWVVTRRWIIGAVTGFVAVIAALAGSALLFQQNQLLRTQGDLMREQTERLTEQTLLLQTQIQLGEAQRSTSIVPEILAIGAAIAEETTALPPVRGGGDSAERLSPALRARIVAATLAARPYRYLAYGFDRLDDDAVVNAAIERRIDLPQTRAEVAAATTARAAFWQTDNVDPRAAAGELTDRIVSPERGQLLGTLYNAGLSDLTRLTYEGVDFSFAEVRHDVLSGIDLRFGRLEFADFSRVSLAGAKFSAARLDHARFVRAQIGDADFGSILNEDVPAPFEGHPLLGYQPTRLVGADFSLADMQGARFMAVQAISASFDGAAVFNADFSGALLLAATFRNAVVFGTSFVLTDLTKSDFAGAVVFEPDFLERVAREAAEGSFDPRQYRLEPISDEQMTTHPNLNALARLPVEVQNSQPPLRIVRIAPIEPETPAGQG